MKQSLFIILLVINLQQSLSQSFKTEDGYIKFISKAPFNEFDGESNYLHGLVDLDKNLLDFYVDLNTLKTGISLRDSHMRDSYLETNKYPYAEFTGELENIGEIDRNDLKTGLKVTAKGTFKIHGLSKKRTINGLLTLDEKGRLTLETNFKVALQDHEIEKPSLLGYELADVQDVEIKAVLNEQ